MIPKGLDKFREKLPILAGKKFILLPIFTIFIITLFSLTISYVYQLPNESNNLSALLPLLGIIIIESIAVLLIDILWLWRDKLKAKYQQTSYQRIIFFGLGGIIIKISIAFNNFTPIRLINPQFWENSSFSYFVVPLTSLIEGNLIVVDIIRIIFGLFLLLLGFMTMARSLTTFGIDYMAVVYLYFPEESEVQNYEIYSILRHPAYSGVILVCFAGFIFNFSLFNLLYFLIFIIGFSIHIFVEEKELIQRFGESYDSYRKSVPAILVRPKNWKLYFKFLLGIA